MKSKTQNPLEPLLNAQDVKRLLNCSLSWVYKAADRGLLPSVRWECPGDGTKKPKTMVRFKLKDVLALVEKHYEN
jgi:hypothetical protein